MCGSGSGGSTVSTVLRKPKIKRVLIQNGGQPQKIGKIRSNTHSHICCSTPK